MKKLLRLILCTAFIFAQCPLVEVNGLAGRVCEIETSPGMTFLQVKEAISAQTGISCENMILLRGTEKLSDESVIRPEITQLSLVLECYFVKIDKTYEEMWIIWPGFEHIAGNGGDTYYTLNGKNFPKNKYTIDEFFSQCARAWDHKHYSDMAMRAEDMAMREKLKQFPGFPFTVYARYNEKCRQVSWYNYSFYCKQNVIERMVETGVLSTFFPESKYLGLKEAQLFYAAIAYFGGILVREPRCTYMTSIFSEADVMNYSSEPIQSVVDSFCKQKGDYARSPDGTIPGVRNEIVDFMDKLLPEQSVKASDA